MGKTIQTGRDQATPPLISQTHSPFPECFSLLNLHQNVLFKSQNVNDFQTWGTNPNDTTNLELHFRKALPCAKLMIPRTCLKTAHPAFFKGIFL
jgi:hypothetical protein